MANSAIKGITVEIGGNTTKLGKALQDSEKKTRSLQVELRNIDKALKFNPNNVELLTQKQDILTQTVKETTDKLSKLKEVEDEIAKKAEAGIINEEEFRAFKREVVETESKLNHYEKALTDVKSTLKNMGTKEAVKETKEYKEAVEDAKESLDDFKEKAGEAFDFMTGVGVAVGGAMVTATGYALNLSTEFDKAFNTLVTQTGASKEEMDGLNESMENIYANNFGESIQDVAESMAIVKQNTQLSGKELESTTEYALMMRDVFDFDVSESTRSASMLMEQFGLTAEEAYDLMAQGAQSGLNKNGDLMDVINEYSVHFAQMGFDATETFNILQAGADSGAFSVDKVGDAFKEFGIRVKDESDTTKQAFKDLGLDADQMSKDFATGGDTSVKAFLKVNEALAGIEDPLLQNQIGVALYGTMWEDLGDKAVTALSDYGDAFNTTGDTLKSINEIKYDDIGSAVEGLGRTFQTEIAEPLGDEVKPIVEDVIGYVQENAPQIKDTISNVVDKVSEFASFIADNGPTIISVLAGIGTALAVFKIGGIIASAIGAITSFIGLIKTGTGVFGALNAVMSMNPIVLIIGLVAGLVVAFIALWNNCDAFREFWLNLWNKITEFCSTAVDKIKVFFTETVPSALNTMVNWFKQLPTKIWNFLVEVVTRIVTWRVNMVKKAIEVGTQFVEKIVSFVKQLPGKIWNFLVSVVGKVTSWTSNMVTKARTAGSRFINAVINYVKNLPGRIWTWLVNTANKVVSWGSNLASKGREAGRKLLDAVVEKVREIPGRLLSIGSEIVSGLWSGITNKVGWLKSKISGFVGDVTGWLKKFFKIESPSKLMRDEIGKYIAEGIGVGIEENADKPLNALSQLGEDMLNQDISLNGATINRRLNTTFSNGIKNAVNSDNLLLNKLDGIYDRLSRLQIVLDTGTLVGETIDKIDAGLATRQLLNARGV